MTRHAEFPIYCLNLARRPDRRIQAWQQFRREGLEVQRITAPDALPVSEARAWRNKGARACAAAHRLAWREARKAGAEGVSVFEDDVVLCRGFRERLAALDLPEDWEVLYFGCVFREAPEVVAPGLLRVTGPTWDTHAYMMRRSLWRELGAEWGAVSFRNEELGMKNEEAEALGDEDRGRGRERGRGGIGDEEWWAMSAKERGARRLDTASDVILAEYHSRVKAYAVWPPMAWQVEGLSNNENSVRGNYRRDGTQAVFREAIRGLPGVMEEEAERRRDKVRSFENPVRQLALSGDRRSQRCAGADSPGGGFGAELLCGSTGQRERESQGVLVSARAQPRPTLIDSMARAQPRSTLVDNVARAQRRLTDSVEAAVPRGILLSPYSAESERMAYAAVRSLRLRNADLPVLVLAQGYLCGLDWRGLAMVKTVRAAEPHRSERMWFNKLAAIEQSPFEETIFMDCDYVLCSDPAWWFEHLGTDELTYFHTEWTAAERPDALALNHPNPHRMREQFGVTGIPVIDGGGHFFVRRTARARTLLARVAEIMDEALEAGPESLYRRMAGAGNIPASDELAACIVMVEHAVKLPAPLPADRRAIGVFMPPYQREETFDFAAGHAEYYDTWCGQRLRPGAVHFCAQGKRHPAYLEWIAQCCGEKKVVPSAGRSLEKAAGPAAPLSASAAARAAAASFAAV